MAQETQNYLALMGASSFDFLLIELVPLAFRMAAAVDDMSGVDADRQRESVHRRLDLLGYRVGQGLIERFSRDRPRFLDSLDVVKFLCKDLWVLLFRKQIDNLKTNHRGVYVLTDNAFRPFSRMSTTSASQAAAQAQPFLWYPCGIIRGALASAGIDAAVHAEPSEIPTATFQIKTAQLRS